MANPIRPEDLPPVPDLGATDAMIVDTGAGVYKTTPTDIVEAGDGVTVTALGASGGAGLVGVPGGGSLADSGGSGGVGFLQAGTGAIERSVQDKSRDEVSFFDFATAQQKADIVAFNRAAPSMSASVDTAVTATLSSATKYIRGIQFSAGVVTGPLSWPPAGSGDTRGGGMRIKGVGRGEAFVQPTLQRGTIFYSADTANPTFTFKQPGPNQGSGALDVGEFRVEGNQVANIPALKFEALFGSSRATAIDVYQTGAGDGVVIEFMATGTCDLGYALNKDWLTNGLGVARTGAGYYLNADTDCGLAQFTKTTARGWNIGYRIGEQGGAARPLAARLSHFECSVVNTGVVLSDTSEGALIDSGYFEGIDTTALIDRGDYTTILAPFIQLAPVGLDLSWTTNTGTNVFGGVTSLPSTGGTAVTVNSASGLKAIWGTAIVNPYAYTVGNTGTGLRLAGADPRFVGFVDFPQSGPWVSTAKKITDISTASSYPATATGGVVGVTPYDDLSGKTHFSWDRGALRLHVDPIVVTESSVSGGVLTLPAGSVYIIQFSVLTVVSSITCATHPDKTLVLINRNGNMQLSNSSTLLLMERTGNYTPPTNGSVHLFQAIPNALRVMQELFRTSNRPRTAPNAAGAGTTGWSAGDTIYMTGATRPAWWDGASWKYADGTAAA